MPTTPRGRRTAVITPTSQGDVTVTLSRTHALALLNAADKGLKVIIAFEMIQNTSTTEAAIGELRAATERR